MKNAHSVKGLNIALWIVQFLLAAMFIMAGANKLFQPISELSKMLPWVTSVPEGLIRFIGASELAGGIGILVPSVARIQPKLTVLAAIGLALIMLLAGIFHMSRGEFPAIAMNLIFISMAAFVAWGRSKKWIILPR